VFMGAVGNTGEHINQIVEGWNIIGYSEGRALSVQDLFANIVSGNPPVGSYVEEKADMLVIQSTDGSWQRLMRLPDDRWFDLSKFEIATFDVQPGQAYYYYRQHGAGSMDIQL
jgi:hypothetical protein